MQLDDRFTLKMAGENITIDESFFSQMMRRARNRGKQAITGSWLNVIEAAGYHFVHGPISGNNGKEDGRPGLALVGKSCTVKKISGFWPETSGYPLTEEEMALTSAYLSSMEGKDVELLIPLRNDRAPIRWFSFEDSREYGIYRDHIYPVILDCLKKTPFRTLLDAGCGAGNLLAKISEEYPDTVIYGVDISDDNVESAREKGLTNVYQGDALNLKPLLPGASYFDVIILCGVLNRQVVDVGTARAILRKTVRLLNTSGSLIITGYSSCHFGSSDFQRMGLMVLNKCVPLNLFKSYDDFALRQLYVVRKM
jgi:SAM-dependent methyltransferase